ncbi:helix-turn-helix domain-containing protein [Psychrobacillus sp. FSL K6-1267]|uniref:helix-turn-helix domain-containing protein n=1 Tax=Psychrobacillus sp. FSL K6-1267 TaxID=2921543 RepID=UPI0030FAB26F
MKVFGEVIKKARNVRGLTLRELAEKAGISHPYLSQLENSKNNNPSPQIVFNLSKILEIPLEEIMTVSDFTDEMIYELRTYNDFPKELIEENKRLNEALELYIQMENYFFRGIGKCYLNENLRVLRKSKDITLTDLADSLEVTQGFLSHVETGKRGMSNKMISVFSDFYGVSISELLFKDLREDERELRIQELERELASLKGLD